jgi:colicin import membrane protein
MNQAMKDATPYHIPKEPGRWRAITLAAVVHLALLAFLWIGIRWHSETPVAIEAEVWSPQAQQAAPKPEPEPEPQPEPTPKVQEAPKPQPAPPVEREVARPQEKPVPDPEIALEQERKKKRLKEEREKRLAEEREEERREEEKERLAAQKKLEQQRAEDKRKKEDLAKAEEAKERKREEELKRKQAEAAEKKREAEEEKKRELAEADKKKKLAEAAEKKKRAEAEAARAEAVHKEELNRMLSQATGSGGSGEAAHTSGPSRGDASYVAKVAGKIRSNTVFNVPEDLSGNPAVEYAVDLLPDGSLRALRKLKSSGVPGFDDAVRRAIEKSQPFPADKTGRVPSGFTVSHKPKDQ